MPKFKNKKEAAIVYGAIISAAVAAICFLVNLVLSIAQVFGGEEPLKAWACIGATLGFALSFYLSTLIDED